MDKMPFLSTFLFPSGCWEEEVRTMSRVRAFSPDTSMYMTEDVKSRDVAFVSIFHFLTFIFILPVASEFGVSFGVSLKCVLDSFRAHHGDVLKKASL